MDEIRNKHLDLILIDGGRFYPEKNLPFYVTVICKLTKNKFSDVNRCYRSRAEIRAAFNFEFKDLKIYASLHDFNFGVDEDTY